VSKPYIMHWASPAGLPEVMALLDERRRWLHERDHNAEVEQRRPWMTLIQDATTAGKVFRRARIISEPATDYIRYEWEGTGPNVEAGEEIKWLPRRLASAIALPGNDFWLFDDSTVVFTVFTGEGDVFERQLTTDPGVVEL
jgi:hypothetical protein